jgi:hypothetical protein
VGGDEGIALLIPIGVRGDPLPCLRYRNKHHAMRIIQRDPGKRPALVGFGLSFGGGEAFGFVLSHLRHHSLSPDSPVTLAKDIPAASQNKRQRVKAA